MNRIYAILGLLPCLWIGGWVATEDSPPSEFKDVNVELTFAPSQSNERGVLIVQTLAGVHLNRKVTVFTTSLMFRGARGGMSVGGKARQSLVQSPETPAVSTDLAFALVDRCYMLPEGGGSISATWGVAIDDGPKFSINSPEYNVTRDGMAVTVSEVPRQ